MNRSATDASEGAPSSPTPKNAPLSPAGLWRRFGAFVHELLFLVAYLFITGLIFAAFSGESMQAGRPQILSGPVAVFQQLYLFITVGVYFIFFWIKNRRTLAFKTWHLRIVAAHDMQSAPTLKQAIIRYLATWIGPALALIIFATLGKSVGGWWLCALFANFLWAIVDPAKQFLHDRIARTRVVQQID
jgi:uncharacterized RDD family membrane protein YckC